MSKASELAYQYVRGKILDGSLAPGTQLTETDIAALCGVSRTPVREAMQRLTTEMLLFKTDNQRTFVSSWSTEAVEDLFKLRTMLEAYAAERATRMMTPETLDALKQCSFTIGEGLRQRTPDVECFRRGNAEFHRLVREAVGSELPLSTLSRLILVPVFHQTVERYSREQLARSQSDHDELIAAFEAQDTAWASAIMACHVRRARQAYFSQKSPMSEIEGPGARQPHATSEWMSWRGDLMDHLRLV